VSSPNLEAQRRAQQTALLEAGTEIELGSPADAPLPVAALAAVRGDEPFVVESFHGGLTAIVHRLRLGGRDWALKLAHAESRVHNDDGRLAFVNELQRRADFMRLKALPGGRERFSAIADTTYASLHHAMLLSPWIEGGAVRTWDERTIGQAIAALLVCAEAGLFDWDPSPGNLIDDGTRLRLFDFGYLYPFDPLRHFNSAGRGDDAPQFHPIERFETRTFFAHLLELERRQGIEAALAAFRLEKGIALEACRAHRAGLASRHASAAVLARLDGLIERWQAALAGDLAALYVAEGWRSHALDLDDDLSGRSCTPVTLARADWLIQTLGHSHDILVAQGALARAERDRSAAELLAVYRDLRSAAERWQLPNTPKEPR
jgi:hypothetical protein